MFLVRVRYMGAYGKEILSAKCDSWQEAIEHTNVLVQHMTCLLKVNTLTRPLMLATKVHGGNIEVFTSDPRRQYGSSGILCMIFIEEEVCAKS
jgi:hypothetical protein